MSKKIISIQGYPGSFHDQAARLYFSDVDIDLLPADSFEILARQLSSGESAYAVMAIENSIAGSILQNYRILRDYYFHIEGEIYLSIDHCLLANAGTSHADIKTVYSHPMALNQCLDFLHKYLPDAKLVESDDTALSAFNLANKPNKEEACIASKRAASLSGLNILNESIQSNKFNYTRFFIIRKKLETKIDQANKASVYFRIPDQKGQLLKVLQVIHNHDMNMSKLQSYPVLGSFREYYFHIDIEFEDQGEYAKLRSDLKVLTEDFNELGVYKRADIELLNKLNTTVKEAI
jgi:prephenate dehydratase